MCYPLSSLYSCPLVVWFETSDATVYCSACALRIVRPGRGGRCPQQQPSGVCRAMHGHPGLFFLVQSIAIALILPAAAGLDCGSRPVDIANTVDQLLRDGSVNDVGPCLVQSRQVLDTVVVYRLALTVL